MAVVTGSGAGGIGEATAVRLAEAGARIVLNDRIEGTTESVIERVAAAGGEAIAVVANMMRADAAEAVIGAAVERWGRLDILVNVVGGMRHGNMPVWELPEDAWDFTIALNLKTTFLATKFAAPLMIEQRSGRIVNIASISATGAPQHAHYAAAKAGVIGFTRSCAAQLARYDVTVNAVSPGATMTDAVVRAGFVDARTDWSRQIPLGRPNEPGDIADAVYFLASDAARNITGANLTVAGGLQIAT